MFFVMPKTFVIQRIKKLRTLQPQNKKGPSRNFKRHCVESVCIRSYSGLHFSRIRTEYGEIRSNSEYELFLRSVILVRANAA